MRDVEYEELMIYYNYKELFIRVEFQSFYISAPKVSVSFILHGAIGLRHCMLVVVGLVLPPNWLRRTHVSIKLRRTLICVIIRESKLLFHWMIDFLSGNVVSTVVTPNSSSQLHILLHYGSSLCVDSTKISVLKESN